jgi:hypothetical protein
MNPEFRQRLNALSRNLESANETAAENIYTFTQLYIDPCITGFKLCLHDCTAPCFPDRDERLRRRRGRSRGRADLSFEFYDDWDDQEDVGNSLAGWGNDELDSLLAGSRTVNKQPARQRAMSYGSRGRLPTRIPGGAEPDPTIVPSSSYFGFLERLPFKIGARGLRYKPSAADLQENPGGLRIRDVEADPLVEEDESETGAQRPRSGTAGSRETQNSLSSRGGLIPSDEEEDAVPLDEEFAVALTRRITNTGDERTSGKSSRRPGPSRGSIRTVSSKSTRSGNKSRRSSSKKSIEPLSPSVVEDEEPPSMFELNHEEDKVRIKEELEVEQRRRAAPKAAVEQRLVKEEPVSLDGPADVPLVRPTSAIMSDEQEDPEEAEDLDLAAPRPPPELSRMSADSGPEPFPDFSNEDEGHAESAEPP